jgi:hypothetical protein
VRLIFRQACSSCSSVTTGATLGSGGRGSPFMACAVAIGTSLRRSCLSPLAIKHGKTSPGTNVRQRYSVCGVNIPETITAKGSAGEPIKVDGHFATVQHLFDQAGFVRTALLRDVKDVA